MSNTNQQSVGCRIVGQMNQIDQLLCSNTEIRVFAE
jgi:hypothetical protein